MGTRVRELIDKGREVLECAGKLELEACNKCHEANDAVEDCEDDQTQDCSRYGGG
ncbi:MAG: hypothetical protein U9N35_09050 [Euryarchaeota archaeon]|nr:hypothetical protein [Euryarchaeota archaeon]